MAIVPVLPPVTAGAVYPTSSPSALIAAAAFAQKPPMAQLRQIVAQSIASGSFVAITFTAADVDQDFAGTFGHSNSVNTSRYTANYAGWYEVSGAVAWAANATGRRASQWFVNGAGVAGSQQATPATAANDAEVPARTMMIYLNVNDYIELQGFQESGGALNTFVGSTPGQSHMMVRWVSN